MILLTFFNKLLLLVLIKYKYSIRQLLLVNLLLKKGEKVHTLLLIQSLTLYNYMPIMVTDNLLSYTTLIFFIL